jgi:hypothetical protein
MVLVPAVAVVLISQMTRVDQVLLYQDPRVDLDMCNLILLDLLDLYLLWTTQDQVAEVDLIS